jgi:hypothetical protein
MMERMMKAYDGTGGGAFNVAFSGGGGGGGGGAPAAEAAPAPAAKTHVDLKIASFPADKKIGVRLAPLWSHSIY